MLASKVRTAIANVLKMVRDLGHRDAKVQAFSGGFSALPVRSKIFPLGQSLKTSHRLQSGLRA
jgi:hypothetical protein